MEQIAPGVYRLKGPRFSNAYAVASEQGIALVDSGSPGEVEGIIAELQCAGFSLSDLQAVVLTHSHGDHMGGAAELARRSGAQILAHHDEAPYLDGTRTLPATSLVTRLLTRAASLLPDMGPHCSVDRTLEDGDVLELLGGARVMHTPGHTPGSICLYQLQGQVMFCGDLLLNGHPLTGRGGLRFSSPLFTVDRIQSRESVQRLLEVPIELLCFGHGKPLLSDVRNSIQTLLDSGD